MLSPTSSNRVMACSNSDGKEAIISSGIGVSKYGKLFVSRIIGIRSGEVSKWSESESESELSSSGVSSSINIGLDSELSFAAGWSPSSSPSSESKRSISS
ncbi:hypothetical protein WICPIJ_008624 [Wickerhamomyces pijperi]|uniref:Uncharacterized protein n=1 Tax=Wickerhamomyces pijperi TaxID=599730 RepID=A0A9P8PW48_WICPI|nr:hypothetical protein WICPIJ_008624 [Wickerhamomyces pijperi]